MLRLIGLLLASFIALPASAQQTDTQARKPMSFKVVTSDPDAPADKQKRWITASGTITLDTPEVFNWFQKTNEINGLTIFFDSIGGSIQGGIRLGDALRKMKAHVAIGRSTPVGETPANSDKPPRHELIPARGVCYSSCAYAFLGGQTRSIHPGAAYGVHMFWPGDQLEGLLSRAYTYSDIERAQRISAAIAGYIQRMGVEMQLLQIASLTPPRGMIRRLTAREIVGLRVATLEFTPATFAGAGFWGVGLDQRRARLVSSGTAKASNGLSVQYSLEAVCSETPGFQDVRFEVAPSERLANTNIAFRRAMLKTPKEDATLAFSTKDVMAYPATFPRRSSDSPTIWISAAGTITAAVLNDAARPGNALRVTLEDATSSVDVPIELGNLPTSYPIWSSACARLQKGGSAVP